MDIKIEQREMLQAAEAFMSIKQNIIVCAKMTMEYIISYNLSCAWLLVWQPVTWHLTADSGWENEKKQYPICRLYGIFQKKNIIMGSRVTH